MSVQYKSIKELKNMLNEREISYTELIQEPFLNFKNNSELKNLKQKAALSENTPYQEIEDYLPDEDLSGILSLKGVQ